jgi:hypothetical protein
MNATRFLCNLVTTSPDKLVKADPAKLAAKYDLTFPNAVEWVRMSLAHHRGRM